MGDRAGDFCFIDSFSVGLDEIPRKEITTERILMILHKQGRFSCFEASANQKIAHAVTDIMHSNLVERYLPDRFKGKPEIGGTTSPDRDTYPWTYVRLTDAGLRMLGAAPARKALLRSKEAGRG
jgi:hypothetical protein